LAQAFRQSEVGEDIATRNQIEQDERDEAGSLFTSEALGGGSLRQ
jgi:hypothetical protein